MLQKVKHGIGNLWPALQSRNYRLYFVGQGISLVGTWMATVAEQWLIYPVLTSNRSLLGIVSAVNLIPTTCLVLFAGVVADRVNKRKAQIIIQTMFAAISFVIATLVFRGVIQVWHVIVATFLSGAVFAFDMPTRQSLMVGFVEKKDYASALSLNAGIFNAARAIGPALAGILIASVGIAPAYVLNSVSFLAVIVSIVLMRIPPQERSNGDNPFRSEMREGFHYLREHKVIAALLLLLAFETMFTWPSAVLMPVFAHDIFRRGEVGFGLLQSAFGLGAMIGALSFSKLFHRVADKSRLITSACILEVIALTVFSLVSDFLIALGAILFSGYAIATIVSTINTLVQMNTPDALRGRMMSFYSFVLVGGMPFGALLGSAGVATIGARLTVLFGAIFFGLTSFGLIAATRGKFHEKLARMG